MKKILIQKLHPDAKMPEYKKAGDSGFDLYCVEDVFILPGQAVIIPTGLAFAIPDGYEMQLRLRSGISLEAPLVLPNAPGTIDAGYRGEVGIIVRNIGNFGWKVNKGERIAQGVIAPVEKAMFEETANLPESERGASGFGSTGRH